MTEALDVRNFQSAGRDFFHFIPIRHSLKDSKAFIVKLSQAEKGKCYMVSLICGIQKIIQVLITYNGI